MPSAVSPNPRAGSAGPERADDPFNYDDDVDDFLKDIPLGKENAQTNNNVQQEPAKDIDEEITVKKKRKPVPKLDEARILSDAGLPRLRKITKNQLKFRGKGHEFSDISRLLNTYQLWLDDLFPRAKFKDGLIDIEKVGHTKRMQVMRRAWLDATKPHQRDASPERDNDFVMSGALPDSITENILEQPGLESSDDAITGSSINPNGAHNKSVNNNHSDDAPDDDELDELLAEAGNSGAAVTSAPVQPKKGPFEEDDSDEDELDTLLAGEPLSMSSHVQASGAQASNQARKGNASFGDIFADEEEAMASMDMW